MLVARTGRPAVAAVAAALVVASCGSGRGPSSDELLSDALTTLAHARSVHDREVQSSAAGTNTFHSDMTQNAVHTKASSSNGAWAETVLASGVLYERGSRTGGRWWVMPDTDRIAAETTTIPGTVGCLRAEHGRFSVVGSLNAAHVVLADDGNAPGAAPGRWYVTTGPPARLTRFVHTGPDREGGPPHCGRTLAGVTIDASYSGYDRPVSITAPTDAVPAPPGTS